TTAAAMAQVRQTLGDEALILSTRRAGGGVEVTAAIEPRGQADVPPAPAADRLASLAWHGVPERIAPRLAAGPLPFALSAALRFGALPLGAG
ncbi:hypothetical protein, partial [Staphylococcus aureus]